MNIENLLSMLKIDLGITTTAFDDRLKQYLLSAERFVKEEGCNPDPDDIQDQQLIVMYAAWTWRRRDTGEGMPRMLRYMLNNRVFHEALKDG